MNMTNVYVLIKPDETQEDIIAELCDDCDVGPDEPFAFSAIISPDKKDKDCHKLKINCLCPVDQNPYTVRQLVSGILSKPERSTGVRYIQPPLDQWLSLFKPLLLAMTTKVEPMYGNIIERDDLLSILYLTVVKLYNQDYYLHQTLIYKSYIRELNYECRKYKNASKTDYLEDDVYDKDGDVITLLDQIVDPDSTAWARQCNSYTEKDYRDDLFQKIRSRMLEDMSEFAFKRILIQLRTKTVDRSTSYQLDKYRRIFNPNYVPRPNAHGQRKKRSCDK